LKNPNSLVHLDRKLAYVVFRRSLEITVLVHGAGRIFGPSVEDFASKTMSLFAGIPLSAALAHAFLIAVPFAEFILGVFDLAGLFTCWAFTLGRPVDYRSHPWNCTSQCYWPTVGIQMIYSISYYFLLLHRAENAFSLDALFGRKRV
jgi:hypothetical protein